MTKPIIGALLSLFAIAGGGPAKAADVTLRVTHEMAAQDAINIAAMRFAERVAERTGGLIDVKVFPAAQLGHDNDSLEQIKLGADLIVITQMAAAAPSEVPDLTILDGPYLYDDLADYRN
jgi:TRAP-type C4-dicarboxylate transport system substrate-binding protein